MTKIAKMILYRTELMETFRLFRELGASWAESLLHASACIVLLA